MLMPSNNPIEDYSSDEATVTMGVNSQVDGVQFPGDHDMLLGRGGETNGHSGNQLFRKFIEKHKAVYMAAPRREKPSIAKALVAQWRSMSPPGRFLAKNTGSADQKLWYEIGDEAARKRTSKSLGERKTLNNGNAVQQRTSGRASPHHAITKRPTSMSAVSPISVLNMPPLMKKVEGSAADASMGRLFLDNHLNIDYYRNHHGNQVISQGDPSTTQKGSSESLHQANYIQSGLDTAAASFIAALSPPSTSSSPASSFIGDQLPTAAELLGDASLFDF